MSKTKRYIQRKAVERIPAPALTVVGKAVLAAVDRAVEDRWDRALQTAAAADGDTVEQRVKSIAKDFRRELGGVGAATGAVAAAPGLGTGAAAATLMADLGWFAMRSTDLIMAIGAAHGHTASTVEERRAWVLSVLAFGEEAAEQFSLLLSEFDAGMVIGGERVSTRLAGLVGGDAATLDAIRRINANLAATVVARYGSRRSLLAIGKLLPFGIGAIAGGSANYALTRVVGKQAQRFFAEFGAMVPPPPPLAPPPPAPGQVADSVGRLGPEAGVGPRPDGAPIPNPQAAGEASPPPPAPGSRRLPNPMARLTKKDRANSIPTDGHPL